MKKANLIFLAVILSFGVHQSARADITAGLVGYWTLDEGSGLTAADSSGSNPGTLSNGPSWTAGHIGSGSLVFDGADDVLNIGSASTVDNIDASGSGMTISAWVFPRSYGVNRAGAIVAKGANYASGNFQIVFDGYGPTLNFNKDYDGATDLSARIAFPSSYLNTWSHLVIVWDGGPSASNVHIYINGAEMTKSYTTSGDGNKTSDGSHNLIAGASSGGNYFDGNLDDVRIYNRPLSSAEVTELYNYTYTPPADTTPPVLSAGSPTGVLPAGTTQTTLSLTTNESASCKYGTVANTAYAAISDTFTTTGGTSHTSVITGLADAASYGYFVRCQDVANNANTADYGVSFSVASPSSDTAPPSISSVDASTITQTGAIISWATDESSDSQVEYGLTVDYGSITALDSSLVTMHTRTLSGLSSNTIYHYRVKSRDASGNLAISAGTTFTTSPVASSYTLSTSKSGLGSGTVSGGSISCGSTCTQSNITSGTQITLTATPSSGSTFSGWSGGGCSGSGSCVVTVTADLTVTATFSSNIPSGVIPDQAKIDWSRNAGSSYVIPDYTEVACTPSDDTGATNMSAQIQTCLNNASSNRTIKLPAGTYRIDSAVTVPSNKTLRGSGSALTKIMLHNANTAIAIQGPSNVGVVGTMKSGATNWTKDSQTISVVQSSAFSVGDYIVVRQKNLSYCANANCTYSGTHTGSNGATTLTDGAVTWTANQWVGYKIENYSAFAIGTITANTSNTITVSPVSNWSPAGRTTWNAGDKYYIYPAGNNYAIPVLKENYDYLPYETSQIVKITSKSADLGGYYDVGLSDPLFVTYEQSYGPEIFKLNNTTNAGIEDLYVEKTDNTSGSNINIGKAVNCWISGVESYKTYNYHVNLNSTYGCVVRDSYFHESWQYGGNAGYGIAMFNNAGNNLVENNIFYHTRHALEMEIGVNGNIYGYNYSKDPLNESIPMDYLMIDAVVHGGGNYMNLYEGNIVAHLGSDNATGGSKYNTFFRNWATRDHSLGINPPGQIYYPWTVDIQKDSLYTNLVGNIFNTPGVNGNKTISWGLDQNDNTQFDTRSQGTANMCGNYDLYADAYQTDNSACSTAIPNSLYLGSKPSWFGSVAWPPIGPDVSGYKNKIPAQLCFENENLVSGGVFNSSACYSSVSTYTVSITKQGNGSGTVSSSVGSINCGSTCTSSALSTNTAVVLTATPASGSTFSGWSGGGCSGTGSCNITLSSNTIITATFAIISDSTLPTISIATPATGATVSGSILISAAASDNVGIAGVQFKLDGSNLGAELINSPYSGNWNTALASNGRHILSATARDAAGNITTSSSVIVTITNSSSYASGSLATTAPAFIPTVLQTRPLNATAPCSTAPSSFARDLTLGSTGADVKALQVFLNTKGFTVAQIGPGSKGQESSYFGPATVRALSLFQAFNNIFPAQGYFGPKTRIKINGLLSSGAAVCADTSAPPVPAVAASFARDLTLGSTGADVKALQVFLNTKGFTVAQIGPGSKGQETSFFGPATMRALAQFQATRGIFPAQGYFGPKTRAAVGK